MTSTVTKKFLECEIREDGAPTDQLVIVCASCNEGCLTSTGHIMHTDFMDPELPVIRLSVKHVFCPSCNCVGDLEEDVDYIGEDGCPQDRQIKSDSPAASPYDTHGMQSTAVLNYILDHKEKYTSK